jgi:hypothetical protein
MTNPEASICPGTQLPCEGKQYLSHMLSTLTLGQLRLSAAGAPAGTSEEDYQASINARIEAGNDKRAAIEKDLSAGCSGSICVPLAEVATRYLFDGSSVAELLERE